MRLIRNVVLLLTVMVFTLPIPAWMAWSCGEFVLTGSVIGVWIILTAFAQCLIFSALYMADIWKEETNNYNSEQ